MSVLVFLSVWFKTSYEKGCVMGNVTQIAVAFAVSLREVCATCGIVTKARAIVPGS